MVLIWLGLTICILWSALRYLPAKYEAYRPLPEVIALIPFLIVPLIFICYASFRHSQIAAGIISSLLIAVHIAWTAGYFIPFDTPLNDILALPKQTYEVSKSEVSKSGNSNASSNGSSNGTVKIMTVNCRYGRADASAIMHYAIWENVDILALQEINKSIIERLENHGLSHLMPYSAVGETSQNDNGGVNGLWSRIQPVQSSRESVDLRAAKAPMMQIPVGSKTVKFASVHPKSPRRGGETWQYGIAHLADFAENTDFDHPAVVAGDFNSTLDHTTFRETLARGFYDSSYEIHKGFNNTFPTSWVVVPKVLELDHIIHTAGIRATAVSSEKIMHTDHAAVIASLQTE